MSGDDSTKPDLFDDAAIKAMDDLSRARRAPADAGGAFGTRAQAAAAAAAEGPQKLAEHVDHAARASMTHLGVPVHRLISLESGGARTPEEEARFYVDGAAAGGAPYVVPEGWSLVVTDISVLGPLVVNDMNLPITILFGDNGYRRFSTHVHVRESCHHRLGAGIVVPSGASPRVRAPADEVSVQLLGYLVEHPGNAEGQA